MSNHWSPDRGRYEDEQHTDPIGYPAGEGSEFHRAVHAPGPDERGSFSRTSTRDDSHDYDPRDTVNRDNQYHDTPAAAPQEVGRSRADRRRDRAATSRRRRGRAIGVLLGLVLLLVVAGGGYAAFQRFSAPEAPQDFASGSAGAGVVLRVNPGDTASQIGAHAADEGVVASAGAFLEAAIANTSMQSVQPGYYLVPTNVPGTEAVAALVDPASRVGSVVISEGRQLHDSRDVNTGAVKKGIYTLISEASCVDRAATGTPICISYQDLDAAGAVSDPDALGVAAWARDRVETVPDRDRQLEGLISAGSWDFDPTAAPGEILKQLVSESATEYEETGILTAGMSFGLDPYDTLVAASLVERESLPPDFSKVARVIINRLAEPQKLEFDSTVNYSLDTTEVATTDADRAAVTPWNTYAKEGLPATPIASPSIGAVRAVESPAEGDWLYFVTINAAGETLFTRSYDEHLANIGKVEGGFLDSGR